MCKIACGLCASSNRNSLVPQLSCRATFNQRLKKCSWGAFYFVQFSQPRPPGNFLAPDWSNGGDERVSAVTSDARLFSNLVVKERLWFWETRFVVVNRRHGND